MKNLIVPAFLTFLFALLLWYIQKDKFELIYSINDSEIFPVDSNEAKFFVVDLENTGNKEIENIQVEIRFKNCRILNISNSTLKSSQFSFKDSNVHGTLPLLNPKEKMKIKCTAVGGDGELEHFEARAKGVSATDKPYLEITSILLPVLILVFIIISISYYLLIRQNKISKAIDTLDVESIEVERFNLTNSVNEKLVQSESERRTWLEKLQQETEEREHEHKEYMKKLEEESKERERKHQELLKKHDEEMEKIKKEHHELEQGKPERTQEIFNCLNQNGLTYLFFKLLNLGDGISYLNTGFILFAEFLNTSTDQDKILKTIQSLTNFEMAPSSKGMLYYLAGKMESIKNNHEKVNYWLNKCKDEYPLMYKFLMENDGNFDINQLRDRLKNNWP
jgi:hypothetical protein